MTWGVDVWGAGQLQEEKRVFSLFADNPSATSFAKASTQIRFQLGQKDRFRQGVVRSGAYLQAMQEVFRQYGLPVDLVFLAHVESSFNPMAYSKFGAAGVWQVTRSTGKRFLTVDYTLDERRDPMRATHAAARYLKENYELLGDWPLAITAYNHGAGGLQKALRKNKGYEGVFLNHRGRRFKFASRNFYSEFLAAKAVAIDYKHVFGPLDLALPQPAIQVTLPGFAQVKAIAGFFSVSIATIKEWNPALREPIFRGQKYIPKGYSLRLPAGEKQLAKQIAPIPKHIFFSEQKPSRFHLVRRGETAGQIARIHKVSLQDLTLANQLDRRSTIYAGQNLRIPIVGEKPILVASIEEKSIAVVPQSPTKTSEKVVKEKLPEPATPGDKQLAETNQVKEPTEEPKVLPQPEVHVPQVNPAIVQGDFYVDKIREEKGKKIGRIRVLVGETLGHYADWLGVRAWDIRRLNGLRYGRAIHVNNFLNIPLEKIGKEKFEEKRFEFHKEIEEDFFAAYQVSGVEIYKIKPGDTIWKLSREEFELPLWLIKKYNSNIDLGRLKLHQEMIVPLVKKV